MKHRNVAIRLFRSDAASALVAYATMAGLIIAMIVGSVIPIGTLGTRMVADARITPAQRVTTGSADKWQAPEWRIFFSLPAFESPRTVALSSAWFAVFLGLTYCWLRRRRSAADKDSKEPEPEETIDPSIEAQILAQRQKIWRALVDETGLVVRNRMTARHVMTETVFIVEPSTRSADLRQQMTDRRVEHAFVCKQNNRLLGVVSTLNLHKSREEYVKKVMAVDPVTVAPDAPLSLPIALMLNSGLSCLPVVSEGRLIGAITTVALITTLQCTLQVFVRIAQYVDQNSDKAEDLGKAADWIRNELPAYRASLARFGELAAKLERRKRLPTEWKGLLDQADSLLEDSKQIGERARRACAHIETQTEQLISLFELRTDPLTGAINRKALDESLTNMFALTNRYGQPFSLILMRIEREGGAQGVASSHIDDGVLKNVAGSVELILRETDLLARYDSNTFALVLAHTNLEGAIVLMERLPKEIHSERDDEILVARFGVAVPRRATIHRSSWPVPSWRLAKARAIKADRNPRSLSANMNSRGNIRKFNNTHSMRRGSGSCPI